MAAQARRILIDTSALIAHLRGRMNLDRIVGERDELYISAISLYELEYGATRAGRSSDLSQFQQALQPIVLPMGKAEAQRAARLNGALARKNQQIGPQDALIAATALQNNLSLLTLNVEEFKRVPGLDLME